MDVFIYLDQNTISNLRNRKLRETNNPHLSKLRHVLSASNIQVVYSHIHLAEINQITIEKYQIEHIDLLENLNAKYIEPLTKHLGIRTPHQVWIDYLENEVQNREDGITEAMKAIELISRKLSGLPVENSFEHISNNFKKSLKALLDSCAVQINSIDIAELEEPLRSQFLIMKKKLPALIAKSHNLETTSVPKDQELGPNQFRECSEIRKLQIRQLQGRDIVKSIEKIFDSENSSFDWRDYFEDTPENRILQAYTLMNWAGYYADDFDKVKKGKDRFRASNNDMQHATMAFGTTFLISDDNAFLMKAKACYEYVRATTIVCSPEEFLRNHCKFV